MSPGDGDIAGCIVADQEVEDWAVQVRQHC